MKSYSILLFSVGLFLWPQPGIAHPGAQDAHGCHTCRTSCPDYGLDFGEYHCNHGGTGGFGGGGTPRQSLPSGRGERVAVPVVRIVDGDTLEVEVAGEKQVVRILGIDTPESKSSTTPLECFGVEAGDRLQELIFGEQVDLVVGKTSDDQDDYGRLLRYVELDRVDVGAKLVEEGYAKSYRWFPHDRLAEYNDLESAAKAAGKGLWEACNKNTFSDVSATHPYRPAIEWGKQQRIVSGYPDGSFRPDQPVNRAEFLKILFESKKIDVPSNTQSDFTDVDHAAWYAPYVRYARQQGIIEGYPDGTFRPAQPVNFAEALKMAYTSLGIETPIAEGAWYERFLQHAKNQNVLFQNTVDVGAGMSRKDVLWVMYKLIH